MLIVKAKVTERAARLGMLAVAVIALAADAAALPASADQVIDHDEDSVTFTSQEDVDLDLEIDELDQQLNLQLNRGVLSEYEIEEVDTDD